MIKNNYFTLLFSKFCIIPLIATDISNKQEKTFICGLEINSLLRAVQIHINKLYLLFHGLCFMGLEIPTKRLSLSFTIFKINKDFSCLKGVQKNSDQCGSFHAPFYWAQAYISWVLDAHSCYWFTSRKLTGNVIIIIVFLLLDQDPDTWLCTLSCLSPPPDPLPLSPQ